MNSNLLKSQSGGIKQSMQGQRLPSLKLIVFRMNNLNLALPIEAVHKVLNYTPIYGSGQNQVGVTHVQDYEVTVVDLYQRFFKSSQTNQYGTGGYLVIVRNTTGELYGIPVADTPVLMEVPLSMIRILPESYRRADTLEVASHVAVIPQSGSPLTVFLLDVDLLLPLCQELTAASVTS